MLSLETLSAIGRDTPSRKLGSFPHPPRTYRQPTAESQRNLACRVSNSSVTGNRSWAPGLLALVGFGGVRRGAGRVAGPSPLPFQPLKPGCMMALYRVGTMRQMVNGASNDEGANVTAADTRDVKSPTLKRSLARTPTATTSSEIQSPVASARACSREVS